MIYVHLLPYIDILKNSFDRNDLLEYQSGIIMVYIFVTCQNITTRFIFKLN